MILGYLLFRFYDDVSASRDFPCDFHSSVPTYLPSSIYNNLTSSNLAMYKLGCELFLIVSLSREGCDISGQSVLFHIFID